MMCVGVEVVVSVVISLDHLWDPGSQFQRDTDRYEISGRVGGSSRSGVGPRTSVTSRRIRTSFQGPRNRRNIHGRKMCGNSYTIIHTDTEPVTMVTMLT